MPELGQPCKYLVLY